MTLSINVVAGNSKETTTVNAHGQAQHIINDTEIKSFRLTDENLKNAVEKYFGKKPNDVFLKSPTPWGGLYETYGWPQVKTILRPINAEIISISSKPVMLGSVKYTNGTDEPGTFKATVHSSVTDTVTDGWNNSNSISLSQSVSYTIGFIEGETSMAYEHGWGQSGSTSKEVEVGQTGGVELPLPAHSVRIAELSSYHGSLDVRITYQASLVGVVAVNYNPPYKGHHFWALDINSVMASASLPTTQTITEELDLDYYSNVSIKIVDG